jgi:hypothetical protein
MVFFFFFDTVGSFSRMVEFTAICVVRWTDGRFWWKGWREVKLEKFDLPSNTEWSLSIVLAQSLID